MLCFCTQGDKPGYIPNFDSTPDQLPHWIGLNLWDPFKFTMKLSAADKEKKLVTELNNGRLAMCAPARPPHPHPHHRAAPPPLHLRVIP